MFRLLIALIVLALLIPTAAAIGPREPTPPQPAATSANEFELAGYAGERFQVSFVQGNTAYVGTTVPGFGNRLTIVGGTDLARPQRISTLDFQDNAIRAIVVSDHYAYVLTGNQTEVRLHVVDVINPAAPFRVANIYLASTSGATGVSLLAEPIGAATGLAVQGNYVYAATGAGGLRIVDIANPLAPTPVGSYIMQSDQGNWLISRVTVADHYAYIQVGFTELRVLDISNPAVPVVVVAYDPQGFTDIVGVVHAGDYLYIASEDSLESVNVSNPPAPTLAGTLAMSSTVGIAMLGQYLYLGSQNPQVDLRIVDIANPAAPTLVRTYDTPGCLSIRGVQGFGPYLYISGDWSAWILDVSDPVAPVLAGSRFMDTHNVAIAGSYAYVTSEAGLHVLDISNPALPAEVGAYLPPGACNSFGIALADQYAYIAADTAGLRVVDISDPTTPTEVGAYSMPDNFMAMKVVVANGYAYVIASSYSSGARLYIIDVSDPAAPTVAGTYAVPFEYSFSALAVAGNYVYLGVVEVYFCCPDLAAGGSPNAEPSAGAANNPTPSGTIPVGMHILDVSQPAQPALAGVYISPAQIRDLIVAGSYAYVGMTNGLHIIDISNPNAPAVIGSHPISPTSVGALTLVGNTMYIANTGGGLWVVDVSTPAAPTEVSRYTGPIHSLDLAVGRYLYVASRSDGFFIIRYGWSITGQITHANGMPAAIAGVSLAGDPGLSATTDVSGTYALDWLPGNTYTIAPSLAGYTFWSPNRSINTPPDTRGQNFTILPAPVGTTLTPGIAGTLAYSDSQGLPTRLDFPADAVSQTIRLGLTPLTIADVTSPSFAGHAFELESSEGAWSFGAPVTVTIAYSAADVRVISDTSKLALWRWDGTAWHDAAESCDAAASPTHDPEAQTLSVAICGTGRYALFGPTHRIYLSVAAHSSS